MSVLTFRHLEPVAVGQIPLLPIADFRRAILDGIAEGGRLVACYGEPRGTAIRLVAIWADDLIGELRAVAAEPSES